MFICRHVLLRAYIPRTQPTSYVTRRLRSIHTPKIDGARTPRSPPALRASPIHTTQTIFTAGASPRIFPGYLNSPSTNTGTGVCSPWFPDATPLSPENENKSPEPPYESLLAAYIEERELGIQVCKNSSGEHFEALVAASAKLRRADVVAMLVEDFLTAGEHLGPLHNVLLLRLLHLTEEMLLEKKHVLVLLRLLEKSRGGLEAYPVQDRTLMTRRVLALPPDPKLDTQLYTILADILLTMVIPRTHGAPYTEQTRSRAAVQLLFPITQYLLDTGPNQPVQHILRILVETDNLMLSHFQLSTISSALGLQAFLFRAMVQSSVQWGWLKTAANLISRALTATDTGRQIDSDMAELVIEVIKLLTTDPAPGDLKPATFLIYHLLRRCPEPIPSGIMQRFYNAAKIQKTPHLAELVYICTRSDGHLSKHPYEPPHDLMWFMRYLVAEKKVDTARQLVAHVVDEDVDIPAGERARFIACVAPMGFATHARALWERYASRTDSAIVVGNASTMLRLVSLFTSLVRREQLGGEESTSASSGPDAVDTAAATGLPGHDDEKGAAPAREVPPEPSRLDHTAFALEDTFAQLASTIPSSEKRPADGDTEEVMPAMEGEPFRELPPHGRAVGYQDGATVQLPRDPNSVLASIDHASGESDLGEATKQTQLDDGKVAGESHPHPGPTAVKDKLSDFQAFAERVLEVFCQSHQPLSEAHHYHLNALARARFMLGRWESGLQALRVLLDRREVPDVYDVNVTLSILAEHEPLAAAKVIERMVVVGLEPDAVTFGCVIHQAILHRDFELVTRLIRRARELNCKRLSYKTMGALIRATITSDEDGEEARRWHLQDAKELVDALLQAKQVPSPNMGRDCVVAALRADDPEMAFRFWKQLVHGKVQWTDGAQTATRGMIARALREHCRLGWIEKERGRVMLVDLKRPPRRSGRGGDGDAQKVVGADE